MTTVGTNTAEMGALGVPMVVALPTHALGAFRGGAGGVLGLLSALPGPVGEAVAAFVNASLLRSQRFFSWPNMWAGAAVVPELIGRIEPAVVAAEVVRLAAQPGELEAMRGALLALRGGRLAPDDGGAAGNGGGVSGGRGTAAASIAEAAGRALAKAAVATGAM